MNLQTVGALLLEQPVVSGQPPHLSAASGLVRIGSWIHVVPDDALHLATFRFPDLDRGRVHRLFSDPPLPADEKVRKRLKPDLESLAEIKFRGHPALLALGSGSTPNRNRGVVQPLYDCGEVDGAPRLFELTPLYEALPFESLNIEGLAAVGEFLHVAQRGNSTGGSDAIIELSLAGCLQALEESRAWTPDLIRRIRQVVLPDLDGVKLTLTDLSPLDDDHLLFTAAAEDTEDPYADGPVAGSVLGRYRLSDGGISTIPLEGRWKLEGVCALARDRFLMVTDGDDPNRPAFLLEASEVKF